MTTIFQDLRFALRGFVRAPAFTVIAVLTLAIGIGANSAIFSVVDGVMLRGLPYPAGEELVVVEQLRPNGDASALSFPDFEDWRRDNQVFAQVAGYHGDSAILTRSGEAPQQLNAMTVSGNFFATLGVQPALGRNFATGEDQDGANRVAILTHRGWQKYFAGDAGVIGRTVSFDQTPYTVVGVMPKSFRFVGDDSSDLDLYLPMPRAFDTQLAKIRGAHYLNAIARLKPGVTLAAANANLVSLAAATASAYPESNAKRSAAVTSMHERLTKGLRPALLILLGAVGFVLLIACANVANLLLARASARHRELAIRIALGAGRRRVVRQLLTESVLLAVVGGTLGVLLAVWGLDALKGVIPDELSRFHGFGIDARVVVFTSAVALLTGIGFGLVPAVQAAGSNPSDALKEAGTRTTAHAGRQRARNIFVAAEIALATLLLVGAALMLRSFQRVAAVDPGFDPENLTVGFMMLPDSRYADDAAQIGFYRRLRAELASVPGAESVAIGAPLPMSQIGMNFAFNIVGAPPPPPGTNNNANNVLTSPEYFRTLRIPVRSGRVFNDADDAANAPQVVVVNEALVRTYFGGESPIGKRLSLRGLDGKFVEHEIVGVVGDVHGTALEEQPSPTMYMPFAQRPWSILGFVVRTTATAGLAATLQQRLAAVDPGQPLGDLTTMEQMMRDTLAKRRLNTLLLGIFAAVAMLLALIGVYGVMSYTVTQRVPEIGIRMALGARPGDVTRMVVGQGLLLALIGVGLGLAGAFGLARLLTSLLYGVSPTDPVSYAAIAGLLLGVAALASWLPARRAARVDPMIALRSE